MWLCGIFLLVLGLVCVAGMAIATNRHGPSGGLPGPDGVHRAGQYRRVALGTAVAGAVVLLLNVVYSGLT